MVVVVKEKVTVFFVIRNEFQNLGVAIVHEIVSFDRRKALIGL